MSPHGKWDDCELTFTITMIVNRGDSNALNAQIKGMSYMMSPPIAWNSWNMTPLDIEFKAFATSNWRRTQSRWRSKVHLMPWIIASQPPLVATPNWCGEKCVAKVSWNWSRQKMWLVSQYNVSHTAMWQTSPEGLVMAKRRATTRTHAIWGGTWPCTIWKKFGTIKRIHLQNLQGENSPKGVQKPSQKDQLSINAACVRTPTWNNQKKAQGLGLARSFRTKVGNSHLIWGVVRWELRWCWKRWVWEKMVPKRKLPKSIPLHIQELNCKTSICE